MALCHHSSGIFYRVPALLGMLAVPLHQKQQQEGCDLCLSLSILFSCLVKQPWILSFVGRENLFLSVLLTNEIT